MWPTLCGPDSLTIQDQKVRKESRAHQGRKVHRVNRARRDRRVSQVYQGHKAHKAMWDHLDLKVT